MTLPDLPAWAEPTAVVRAMPFLSRVPQAVRTVVLAGFEARSHAFGEVVVGAGDAAFVVVIDGEARELTTAPDGSEVSLGIVRRGETFGERSLVEAEPPAQLLRAASREVRVLRLDAAVALALARAHPEAAAGFATQAAVKRVAAFLRSEPSFARLDAAALEIVVARGREVTIADDQLVVAEGARSASWWIVMAGRFVEHVGRGPTRRELRFLRAGEVFGDVDALHGRPSPASVSALGPGVLLELHPDVLAELGRLDPSFATELVNRSRVQLSRVAPRPLDFGAATPADAHVSVVAMPRDDIAADVVVSRQPAESQPWLAPRRFPLVRQIDAADCGAAAVTMVCRALGAPIGHKVSLSYVRRVAGTRQDGTSLAGITRAAQDAGLEVRATKASRDRLDALQLPAIIHWDANHWVVVYAVDGDRVRIADPARGLRRVTRAEVAQAWSGWCATFRATPRLADAPTERLDLNWVRPFVRPMRSRLLLAVLLATVATVLALLAPVLTQRIVDAAARGRSGHVSLLIGVTCLLLLGGLVVGLSERRMLVRAAVRLDADLLDFVSGRLLDLPLAYFETRRTADVERRLQGLRQVRSLLVQGIAGGLSAAIQLVVTFVIMFTYSPVLGLVFLGVMPVYGLLLRFSSRRLRPTFDSLEEAYGRHAAKQLDAIKGIEAAKSAGAEAGLRRGIAQEFTRLAERVFRGDWVIMFYDAGVQLAGFLLFVLFLWVGGLLVADHRLTIGQLVAVNALVLLANAPIAILLGLWDQLQQSAVLAHRLQDVLEAEPEQPLDAPRRAVPGLSGRITLQRVSLTYPDVPDRPVLDDISLLLQPGVTLGLVGRSGSGKSTLVRCLAGLVVPSRGSIRYDEVDLVDLDWRALRRRIGVVLQSPYLFDDTIAANIALGEEFPDPARVERAAQLADAAGFVEALPLGFRTRVGDSGLRLSGGQAQRVCIARALYHDPPVLLLDEATSALDTESEAAVKRNLDGVLAQRTAVVVAHRLSTIRDADVIAVLERGRVVEHGSHDQLLAREGLYHHLHASQLP